MTISSARPEAGGRPGLLARRPLTSFFVMAYAFSWLVWSPWVLGEDGAGLLPTRIDPALIGYLNAAAILAGPTVAGLVMARVTGGRAGVRALLARLVLWRVGVQWYVVALVGVPLIMLVGTTIWAGAGPTSGALGGPSYLLTYVVTFVLVTVLGGPLFEEIGWRGFALPRMQSSLGALGASVVLGVLWALWHLPQFLVPSWAASSGGGGVSGILLFTLTAITFTVVITWLFNHTRASLLIAVLVHSSIDTFSITLGALFPPDVLASAMPFMIGFGAVALVLVAVTRGRLGYAGRQE
ncbi:CPBP family intramembrane glutamic endopeptidase [Actinomycetospora sp. OC33-EN08]|uniref:CPBP family intramembrane glutamic endopeptidase n=1 Tax=Actinomycetospora aurantiaca TaxID=3129233 RepID=A0ABU8MLJ2_9PSEU